MSPTCRDMSATTRRVALILARWVRVADTKLKMSWQFVSARADIYQIFRSAYVEIYYGMGVHTHRYNHTSQRLFLSCSPFCHVIQFVMFWRVTAATPPQHHDRRRGTGVWSDLDGRGSGGTVYWGAYSGQNSAGGGVCYPFRIAMGGPN